MTKENPVVEIYVRLLDEGTDVSRPTKGIVLGNGLFKLLPTDNYDPDDEHWEFLPGSTVRTKEVLDGDRIYLIATAHQGC
jgi:hypothetical protein